MMLIYVLRTMLWSAILLGIVGFAMLLTGNFSIAANLLFTGLILCFFGHLLACSNDAREDRKIKK